MSRSQALTVEHDLSLSRLHQIGPVPVSTICKITRIELHYSLTSNTGDCSSKSTTHGFSQAKASSTLCCWNLHDQMPPWPAPRRLCCLAIPAGDLSAVQQRPVCLMMIHAVPAQGGGTATACEFDSAPSSEGVGRYEVFLGHPIFTCRDDHCCSECMN